MNGYSGLQPVDDLLISGFNILMTNWFVVNWSVFDQDVSFSKYGTEEKEKLMPYSLAEKYANTRYFIGRRRFITYTLMANAYSILCGLLIWAVWAGCESVGLAKAEGDGIYESQGDGILDSEGEVYGIYSFGTFGVIVVVLAHHLQVAFNTRNWAVYLGSWACFSISMLPLNLFLAQSVPRAMGYKTYFTQILVNPLIWLMILLCVVIIVMPLFFHKRFQQVIRFPKYNTVD